MLTAMVSSDRLLVWCVAVCVLCMKDFDLTMPGGLTAVSCCRSPSMALQQSSLRVLSPCACRQPQRWQLQPSCDEYCS